MILLKLLFIFGKPLTMDHYYINPKTVYRILSEKGVSNLYHANTVDTSITFIKHRALLSRHYVEANELIQTPQKSDDTDKVVGVWDHVFLDGADLHNLYRRPNNYGPVLFKMKLDMLLAQHMSPMLVTKSNPWYWKANTLDELKYYADAEEIESDYLTGKKLDAQVMFTIPSPGNNLKLNKYLEAIELDVPEIMVPVRGKGMRHLGEYAFEHLDQELKSNGLGHIPLLKREAGLRHRCTCAVAYNSLALFNSDELRKRFRNSHSSNTQ